MKYLAIVGMLVGSLVFGGSAVAETKVPVKTVKVVKAPKKVVKIVKAPKKVVKK